MCGGVGPMKDYLVNDDRWRSEQYTDYKKLVFFRSR